MPPEPVLFSKKTQSRFQAVSVVLIRVSMEERLTELETKITYQDQIIEDLNTVVIELREKLEKIERVVKNLLDDKEDSNLKDASLEVPPPHY